MKIILYKNSSENNAINKSLAYVGDLVGTLRQATSVLNPVILIEMDNGILNYNIDIQAQGDDIIYETNNLFDNDNTELLAKTFSGSNQTTYSYYGFYMKIFNLVIGQTYTISSTKNMRLGFTNDINNSGSFIQTNDYKYTFTASTSYVLITNRVSNEYEEMFETLMLNYGNSVLPFEPHFDDVSINLNYSIFECNYCYIEEFKRFYFIDDIVIQNNKLFSLALSVDVLESYKNKYMILDAFVLRNEFQYDPFVNDANINYYIDKDIVEIGRAHV